MHCALTPSSITTSAAVLLWSMGAAHAAERHLADFQDLSASVPAGFACEPKVTVTVRAPDESAFIGDRVDLQKLIGGLRAILGFECPDTAMTDLLIVGETGGREVYRGVASESGNWLLADLRTSPATASEPVEQAMVPPEQALVPKEATGPEQLLREAAQLEDRSSSVATQLGLGEPLAQRLDAAIAETQSATEAQTAALTVGDVNVGEKLTEIVQYAQASLEASTDVPSAEAAVPVLNDLNVQLEELSATVDQLPEEAKKVLANLLSERVMELRATADSVTGQQGVGEVVMPALEPIMAKLDAVGQEVYRGAASESGNWLFADLRPSEPELLQANPTPPIPQPVPTPTRGQLPNETSGLAPVVLKGMQCGFGLIPAGPFAGRSPQIVAVENALGVDAVVKDLRSGKFYRVPLQGIRLIPHESCVEAIVELLAPGQLQALERCLAASTPEERACLENILEQLGLSPALVTVPQEDYVSIEKAAEDRGMQREACAHRFERIRRGESRCGITLGEDDRIYLDGRAIGEPIVSWDRPEKLIVYPASPGGRYRVMDACSDLCGAWFVLDLQQTSMRDTFAGKYGTPRDGPEENWIGWSPDGAYAALAYEVEGVSWLYVIRVSDGTSWELLNEGLLVRAESLRWLDSATFEIRTVSCANGLEACWASVEGGATGDLVRVTLTADGPKVQTAPSVVSDAASTPSIETAREAFLERFEQEDSGDLLNHYRAYWAGQPYWLHPLGSKDYQARFVEAGILQLEVFEKTNGMTGQMYGHELYTMWYRAKFKVLRDLRMDELGGLSSLGYNYDSFSLPESGVVVEGEIYFHLTENGWLVSGFQ